MMWIKRYRRWNQVFVFMFSLPSTEEGEKDSCEYLNSAYPDIYHWPIPLSDISEEELAQYANSIGWSISEIKGCML